MDKKPLIVVSLCAVVLFVMASLSNVVGYQSVQTSQQNLIKERINQRELLFQTICDFANNKEIQRIILKEQMIREIFPTSELPVVTKTQIRQMYFFGLILSKIISKTKVQSISERYQLSNFEMQKELSAVIEKDTTLKGEISQLKDSECDCEKENAEFRYPVIICGTISFTLLGTEILSRGFLTYYRNHHEQKPLLGLFAYSFYLLTYIACYFIYFIGVFILMCHIDQTVP